MAVSPETPALAISTAWPLARKRPLQGGREGGALGQAVAGGEAVAEGDEREGREPVQHGAAGLARHGEAAHAKMIVMRRAGLALHP